jgi:hypothetical protein
VTAYARVSQLLVRDLITDPATPRLQMPRSGKGGTRNPAQRKIERYPVSITPELEKLLEAAAKRRPSNAPLLLQKNGQPYRNDPYNNHRRAVRRVLAKIDLHPDVYGLYAYVVKMAKRS